MSVHILLSDQFIELGKCEKLLFHNKILRRYNKIKASKNSDRCARVDMVHNPTLVVSNSN
jgi:hypothetical protein